VTVRTAARSYILDGSLNELEARYPASFCASTATPWWHDAPCVHWKSTMTPMRGKAGPCACMGWRELLTVSRRQVAAVRDEIAHQ
jgi:two-component system response regulator AlgR